MDRYIYLLMVLTYIGFLIWILKVSTAKNIFRWNSVSLLVVLALIYDNSILAFGSFIGKGELLYNLHVVSHWLHVLLTPTLVIFCFSALVSAKIPWAQKGYFIPLGIFLSIILSIWEGIRALKDLQLKSMEEYGVLYYTAVNSSNQLFGMVTIVMLVLIITSILLWYHCKYNLLFWGIILSVIIMALSLLIPSNAFTNLSELALLLSILITKRKLDIGQIYKSEY